MSSYHAVQGVPADFSADPRLVADIIAGRVALLLQQVTEDGLNPMHGMLIVRPGLETEYFTDVLRFTWTPDE